MSEQIDKAKADLRRRKLVIGGTDSEQIMLLIDAHDTQLADIHRLLGAFDVLMDDDYNSSNYKPEYQTHRELRKKYPKENKDEN